MSYLRNILLLCTLACFIVVGFCLLTDFHPAAVSTPLPQYDDTLAPSSANGSYSHVAVILGIAGLIYLKIIWKLLHFDGHQPDDH